MFSRRKLASAWEKDRLRSLPEEEQRVVQRWAFRRLARSWQVWVALILVSQVGLFCTVATALVRGAGGGGIAVVVIWIGSHLIYAALLGRVIEYFYARALRHFLHALDTHGAKKLDSPSISTTSNW